jgi:hypothetical protein
MPADLSDQRVRGIVMAGLGGGLHPSLKVGDVVIDSLSHEEIAQKLPYRKGPTHTASTVVSTPQQREELFKESGAVVVEMENQRVRELARELSVPYVGIRAISDSANQMLDPATLGFVDDLGRVKIKSLLGELVWRPTLITELNRLRKSSSLAVKNLATAVEKIVECFNVARASSP